MPILNSFFCCFLLTLHISVRGSFGSGNNHSSLIARHKVDVALYLCNLSSLVYENSINFLYAKMPVPRFVKLYCFSFLSQ